jgi:multiple sugar transport system substrate-binding protein
LRREQQQTIIVLGVAVIALTALLWYILNPGLTPSEGAGLTRVYFADRISLGHRKVIDRFNQIHQGKIEVVPVDLPFDKFSTNERKELLARSLRSRSDKLDVFAVDLIWVRRFARWCEPLDRYIDRTERERVIPVALRSCIYDTSLVSMPLYIDIGLMYYRKDIIDRLPDARHVEEELEGSMPWPDFRRLRERIGLDRKPYYVFQADDYEGLVCNYLELLAGLDPEAVATDHIDLGSDAARSALQMMVDLVHKDGISPPAVTDFDENLSYSFMLENDAVFVRGWPNFVENFRKTYPDTAKLASIRKAALPHFPSHEPTSVLGGWNLMLSKQSTRKAEAVEFIRFAGTKEAEQILYEAEGFLPVTRDIYQDTAYMRGHPDLAYYHTLLERGFDRPAMVDYTRISDILSYYIHRAIRQDLSVEDALKQASEMVNSNKVLIK